MKNPFIFLVALLLLCLGKTVFAQDVIIKKDNTTVLSKVVEVNSIEIKFKKWANQDGPIYSMPLTDIARINYQNGESEVFSNSINNQTEQDPTYSIPQVQSTLSGFMDNKGSFLRLDGRLLSNNELSQLLDSQNYEKYLKAKKQGKNGVIILVCGLVSGVTDLGWIAFSANTNSKITLPCTVVAGVASFSLIFGGILVTTADNKIKKIAVDYNNGHDERHYSFHVSPSMMRCESPQSSSNYGLGLTFSMNF